jgi:hypothetical protein
VLKGAKKVDNQKQLILIEYLKNKVKSYSQEDWKIKAEYSTDDNDKRVITVQEQDGEKIVFYGDIIPLFNYYMIDIYGLSIRECKSLSVFIGNLIGKSERIEVENNGKIERWQIIFSQFSNPQAIEYMDIRRVGYNATLKCIVNKIYEYSKEG